MGANTVRFKFFKKDELKYLSHLDVLALMERALMRTGMPISYSCGFHPKPKLSFSNPIPLGVQSLAEYCDIELLEAIAAEDFTGLLNLKLPDNLRVIDALSFEKTPENKIPSLMSAIDIVLYEYELLFEKLSSSGGPHNKKHSEKISLEGEELIEEDLSFGSLKNSFLKDFGKLFGTAGENEECDADLQKIKSSIHDYEAATAQTVITDGPAAAMQTRAADDNKSAGAAKITADAEIMVAAKTAAEAAAQTAAAKTSSSANQSTAAAAQTALGPPENIFFLKIYGYAKILKNSSNTIFKFNAFNDYFEKFLGTRDIELRQVQKTGTYIFKDNILKDPIEIISF